MNLLEFLEKLDKGETEEFRSFSTAVVVLILLAVFFLVH